MVTDEWIYKESTRVWKKWLQNRYYKINIIEKPKAKEWHWSLLHKATNRKPYKVIKEGEADTFDQAAKDAEEAAADIVSEKWQW